MDRAGLAATGRMPLTVPRVGGAVLAALAMGVVSSVVAVELSPIWGDFTFFVVLLVVLLLRPQGLFGVRLRGAA